MFSQLVIAAVGILAAILFSFVLLFVGTILKTVAAKRGFEKRGAGLKIADGFSVWSGHVYSYLFGEGQMYAVGDLLKRHGVKTIGWMYGYRKAAATVDLDLVQRMVVDHQENERVVMNLPIKELEVDCLMTVKGEQWRGIRRAYATALKSNKFKTPNVQREIENSINKLIGAIDSKLDEAKQGEIELNIDDYAHRYSLDLVFSCFYKQDNLIDFYSEIEPLIPIVDSGYEAFMWSPLVRLCVIFPILKSTIDWLTMKFHQQGVWRRQIMNFIKLQTKLNFEARKHLEKMKRSGAKVADEDNFSLQDGTKFSRNMIDHVIDQFYEGKLTKREFFHSTWFLFNASEKTATDAITRVLYHLGTRLDVQDHLRKSIQADGAESEYLSWVINESLRLLPPVPIGCGRMASQDYKCEDGNIPPGTFVVPAVYTIHRLEQYWGQDAEEFKPERFANSRDFHPLQYMPFGAGARSCPGKEFVLHEMKKLISSLLTRYRLHCEPLDLKYDSPFFFLQLPNQHVMMKVSRIAEEARRQTTL